MQYGCFKYFELGGPCVSGPIGFLSGHVLPFSPLVPRHSPSLCFLPLLQSLPKSAEAHPSLLRRRYLRWSPSQLQGRVPDARQDHWSDEDRLCGSTAHSPVTVARELPELAVSHAQAPRTHQELKTQWRLLLGSASPQGMMFTNCSA